MLWLEGRGYLKSLEKDIISKGRSEVQSQQSGKASWRRKPGPKMGKARAKVQGLPWGHRGLPHA